MIMVPAFVMDFGEKLGFVVQSGLRCCGRRLRGFVSSSLLQGCSSHAKGAVPGFFDRRRVGCCEPGGIRVSLGFSGPGWIQWAPLFLFGRCWIQRAPGFAGRIGVRRWRLQFLGFDSLCLLQVCSLQTREICSS